MPTVPEIHNELTNLKKAHAFEPYVHNVPSTNYADSNAEQQRMLRGKK